MNFSWPGFGFSIGILALLVVCIIVISGHCTFNGSVGLGLH